MIKLLRFEPPEPPFSGLKYVVQAVAGGILDTKTGWTWCKTAHHLAPSPAYDTSPAKNHVKARFPALT